MKTRQNFETVELKVDNLPYENLLINSQPCFTVTIFIIYELNHLVYRRFQQTIN